MDDQNNPIIAEAFAQISLPADSGANAHVPVAPNAFAAGAYVKPASGPLEDLPILRDFTAPAFSGPNDSATPINPGAFRHPEPVSAEATIADLNDQLNSAQDQLISSLVALRSGGNADLNLIAQGDAQLGTLLALKRQLSQTGPAAVAAVRAEIVACVANASTIAKQAEAAATPGAGQAMTLASASQAARTAVASFEDDFYKNKIFDPYLRFSSPEDEEKYRREEAARREEIDRALALHTPEGDLRANRLAAEQVRDAGAHGADRSPEYAPLLHHLESSGDDLAARLAPVRAATQEREAATSATPSTDAAPVDPAMADAVARFRAQAPLADPNQEGHGLSVGKPVRSADAQPLPSH